MAQTIAFAVGVPEQMIPFQRFLLHSIVLYHTPCERARPLLGPPEDGTTEQIHTPTHPLRPMTPKYLPSPIYRDCWHGSLSGLEGRCFPIRVTEP